MLKRIILIALLIVLASIFAEASDNTRQSSLVISLNFPENSGIAMKAPKAIPKPEEISKCVFLDISPAPSNIKKDRYLAEYFLGDNLIYKTTGFDSISGKVTGFGFMFDTAKFENGRYKLIVNFWDENGPSAIGSREVIINNESGE